MQRCLPLLLTGATSFALKCTTESTPSSCEVLKQTSPVCTVHDHQEHITQRVQNLLAHSRRAWQGNSTVMILTLRLGGVPFKEMAMHLYCPLLQALQTLQWNCLTNWNKLVIDSRWQNRISWQPLKQLRQLNCYRLPLPLTGRGFFGWCKLSTEEYITVWPTTSLLHLFSFISDNEENHIITIGASTKTIVSSSSNNHTVNQTCSLHPTTQ